MLPELNLAYCIIFHHIFISAQHYATAPAPEKIEVFVNDKSLLVDPGITVLQVRKKTCYTLSEAGLKTNGSQLATD